MGKKKFIDKKKSATFQLLARDTSDLNTFGSSCEDRVFVRVDKNPYAPHGFQEDSFEDMGHDSSRALGLDDDDPNSIFADAPGDNSDEFHDEKTRPKVQAASASGFLPADVRREILELGFPDDGYNYLIHLREIKNVGGGSSFFHNSKARLDQVPLDVKAYDASKLRISQEVDDDLNTKSIYTVASKTKGVKIQKAVDPDVAALLDDDDLSRFGSDVEDLEEDFVLKANLPDEEEETSNDEKIEIHNCNPVDCTLHIQACNLDGPVVPEDYDAKNENVLDSDKPRVRRLLDEQFDLLTRQEYDSDDESHDGGSVADEEECLAAKLNKTLKGYVMDDLDLSDKYRVPGDYLRRNEESVAGKQVDFPADVIRRCAEYAAVYEHECESDEDMVVMQESSDESEIWDCETIVSTFSNLDNHPGKIQAPEKTKRKLSLDVSKASDDNGNIISLKGKEKLPVDFLPQSRKPAEKIKKAVKLDIEKKLRRPHGESKEEKKERKNAIKEEKREARRAKKEMKGLYRCEAQRAQKVAAISGPSSVHLM